MDGEMDEWHSGLMRVVKYQQINYTSTNERHLRSSCQRWTCRRRQRIFCLFDSFVFGLNEFILKMSAAVWFHFITGRLFSALFLFAPRLFVFYCLFVSFAFTCFMQITLQTPRQSFWDGVSVFVLLSLYELRHLNFSQRYSYIFQKLPFKEECASACSCQLWFLCTKEKDSWLLHFETKTCCLDWWFYFAATIITWNIHLMQSTDIIKNCV